MHKGDVHLKRSLKLLTFYQDRAKHPGRKSITHVCFFPGLGFGEIVGPQKKEDKGGPGISPERRRTERGRLQVLGRKRCEPDGQAQ